MQSSEKLEVNPNRIKYKGHHKFCTTFIHEDASAPPETFFKNFPKDMCFDMVSTQFSMHYMLSTEQKARNFFENVSQRLCNGGYFISTFPDANVLMKKLRETDQKDDKGRYFVENQYYSLITETLKVDKNKGPYGHPYGFYLQDGLVGNYIEGEKEDMIEYVPEYLVILPNLIKIAKEYGLELCETWNFHEFFARNITNEKYYRIFSRSMKFDVRGDSPLLMDADLWDVSYLYRVIAFKKVEGTEMNEVDRSLFKKISYYKLIKKKFDRKK